MLVNSDGRNRERIFPYIGGEDLNTSPTQENSRYAISFGGMSLEEAARYPELLQIVSERVRPGREKLRRDNAAAQYRRKHWWRYAGQADDLYASLQGKTRCLAVAMVTKHLAVAFQPNARIFSNALVVFSLDNATHFVVLQSRPHDAWARFRSSSLENRLRYSASDCFETFPFPQPDPRTVIPELEAIGENLYESRAAYMVDTNQGLTKTYNALKDPTNDEPRIVELRLLHEQMDRAVLDAYGWPDIPVPPFCPRTPEDKAALQSFEDEVIDRLYVLNAARAREEDRLGLRSKKGTKKKTRKKEGAAPDTRKACRAAEQVALRFENGEGTGK